MGRPVKFPDPNDYPPKIPAVLCPADRVMNLFNQNSGQQAQRISQTVRDWFYGAAHHAGWAGAHFLPEVQSQHGAGCVLWAAHQAPPQQINITQQTLVLMDSSEED